MASRDLSLLPQSASVATDRALAILELLAQCQRGLTASEIARELDLPHNSVSRIIDAMTQRGWLYRREDDRRFTLTNLVADLSRPRVNDKSLVVCAWESMKRLRHETGESAQLISLSEHKALVLEQCESDQAIKVAGRVGLRVPAYSCAPGKAILAALPATELEAFFRNVKLKKFTPTTRATRRALEDDLAATRERGFALDLSEGLDGIHCVAAAILDDHFYPVAALTVIGPSFRLTEERFGRMGEHCIAAAAEVRNRLLQ